MIEAKFTKGPWKKVTNRAGSVEVEFECGPTRNGEYLCIGIATDDEETTSGPKTNAIADLIAAAPEMYEEIERDVNDLIDLLSTMDRYSDDYLFYESKLERKQLLLAKARGESC